MPVLRNGSREGRGNGAGTTPAPFSRTAPARGLALAAALALALGGRALPAGAQALELGLGAGLAAPLAEAGDVRGPGLHLAGYAGVGLGPRLVLRGEVRVAHLDADGAGGTTPPRDLRAVGAGAALAWYPAGRGRGVYGLAGAGMYALRSEGGGSDGPVAGMSLGLGGAFTAGGAGWFAEARVEVPFSTFGTGTESAPLTYLPVAAGVRIPCCGS